MADAAVLPAKLVAVYSIKKIDQPALRRGEGPAHAVMRGCWPVILCLAFALCRCTAEELRKPVDYHEKAALLCNLARFVHWPGNAFASTNAPLVVGVVGDDPLGKHLSELPNGDVIRTHPLVFKKLGPKEDLTGCQLLFISRSEKNYLGVVLQQVSGKPVLTVADMPGAAELGVMVVVPEVASDPMTINLDATKSAGLKISSKLLRLASIVSTASPRSKP